MQDEMFTYELTVSVEPLYHNQKASVKKNPMNEASLLYPFRDKLAL